LSHTKTVACSFLSSLFTPMLLIAQRPD